MKSSTFQMKKTGLSFKNDLQRDISIEDRGLKTWGHGCNMSQPTGCIELSQRAYVLDILAEGYMSASGHQQPQDQALSNQKTLS